MKRENGSPGTQRKANKNALRQILPSQAGGELTWKPTFDLGPPASMTARWQVSVGYDTGVTVGPSKLIESIWSLRLAKALPGSLQRLC